MDKLTGKKIIIFGAGRVGKKALIYFGSRSVKCFSDNNKAGDYYCGKNVISFEELCKIHEEYYVVLAVAYVYKLPTVKQLTDAGIPYIFFRDLLTFEDYEVNPILAKFKNKHNGERCFLIGNGPSLKAEDLDVLHGSNLVSFGCNYVYKIFPHTFWRPKYYYFSDTFLLKYRYDTIINLDVEHIFIGDTGENAPEPYGEYNGKVFFYEVLAKSEEHPLFSREPARCIASSYTSMYAMIQWAAYMGFSEMYLLGVDNSYKTEPGQFKANADIDHFCEGYLDEQDVAIVNFAKTSLELEYEGMTNTYIAAEAYSREYGFRIYNATRGGRLEVFERVNFDDLF